MITKIFHDPLPPSDPPPLLNNNGDKFCVSDVKSSSLYSLLSSQQVAVSPTTVHNQYLVQSSIPSSQWFLDKLMSPRLFTFLKVLNPNITVFELSQIAAELETTRLSRFTPVVGEAWGKEFFKLRNMTDLPVSLIDEHSRELREAGSLEQLLLKRIQVLQHNRLSVDRLQKISEHLIGPLLRGDLPDDSLLFKPVDWERFRLDVSIAEGFARDGIHVFTGPKFLRSSVAGPPSKRYRECGTAINAHIFLNCEKGFGVIINKSTAEKFVPDRHVQKLGWEPASKEKGRLTCNCSGAGVSSSRPEVRLNCEEVHQEANERWGFIRDLPKFGFN